jgi:hypothetical protein
VRVFVGGLLTRRRCRPQVALAERFDLRPEVVQGTSHGTDGRPSGSDRHQQRQEDNRGENRLTSPERILRHRAASCRADGGPATHRLECSVHPVGVGSAKLERLRRIGRTAGLPVGVRMRQPDLDRTLQSPNFLELSALGR